MKKILALVLILVLSLGTFAMAETANSDVTVACVHRNLLGVSGVNLRAAYYYEAEKAGVNIMFFNGDHENVQAQCDYIDDLMTSGEADSFIVWTCDADGIAATVQNMHDEGVPTITVDIAIPAESDAFVTAGNYEMGVMTGESAVQYLTEKYGEPKGKVYVITATTQSTARDRTAGFLSVIEQYPNIEVVDTYDMPDTSVDKGPALADDLIMKYPEGTVDVYFCMNMTPMLGLISAAATYERQDFVVVGGFDYNDVFVADMQDEKGVTYSFVAQDAFDIGCQAFRLAVAAAKGEAIESKEVFVPGQLVNHENLDAYMADYNEKQEIIAAYQ